MAAGREDDEVRPVTRTRRTIKLIDFDDPDAERLPGQQPGLDPRDRAPPPRHPALRQRHPGRRHRGKDRRARHVDWAEGAKQCDRYDREIPQLYASNCFCVGVNELRMKYGVPGSLLQHWQQWRDPSPHTEISSFDEMKCTLYGLFDRGNLLDIIANFIVFDVEDGKRDQEGRPVPAVPSRQQDRRSRPGHREAEWRAARHRLAHPGQRQVADHDLRRAEAVEPPGRSSSRRSSSWSIANSSRSRWLASCIGTNTENVAVAGTKRELRDLARQRLPRRDPDPRPQVRRHRAGDDQLGPTSSCSWTRRTARSTATWASSCGRRCRTPRCSASPERRSNSTTGTRRARSARDRRRTGSSATWTATASRTRSATAPPSRSTTRSGSPTGRSRTPTWTRSSRSSSPIEATRSGASSCSEAKLEAILKHPRRIAQVAERRRRLTSSSTSARIASRRCWSAATRRLCVLYKVALDAALQERLGGEDLDDLTRIVISEDLAHDSEVVQAALPRRRPTDRDRGFQAAGPARARGSCSARASLPADRDLHRLRHAADRASMPRSCRPCTWTRGCAITPCFRRSRGSIGRTRTSRRAASSSTTSACSRTSMRR